MRLILTLNFHKMLLVICVSNALSQFQIFQESTTFPGDATVLVTPALPSPMTPGQTASVTVVMKNVGTSTWTDAASAMNGDNLNIPQSDPNIWGTGGALFPARGLSVAPGQSVTFAFTVTAPTSAGTYPLRYQMLHQNVGWFGDISPTRITVAPPPAPVIGLQIGDWQPKPALINQTITAPVTASVTANPYQSPTGDSISQHWAWATGGVYGSADGSPGSFTPATNYVIGWDQGSATTQFRGSFSNPGYYIVQVTATLTYHDDTTGQDVCTASGSGYIGGSISDLASSGSSAASANVLSANVLSAHQALQPRSTGTMTVDGMAVAANPIDHLAYSTDGVSYQSVNGTVNALAGQTLWFQAYKDATTASATASVTWRQGHTSADGTQKATALNSGSPVNPIQVTFNTFSAGTMDASQDVTAIVGTAYLAAHVIVTPAVNLKGPLADGMGKLILDTNGNAQALAGQQITASLNGSTPSTAKVTSYVWDFSGGTPIKNWDKDGVAADGKTPQQLFPLLPSDLTQTDTTGNGISVNPISFYDQAADKLTARCVVNLKFPDGTTASATAISPSVTFMKPTVSKWSIYTGYVQHVQNPSGQRGYQLMPAPGSTNAGGEAWSNTTIVLPPQFAATGGLGCFAQLITPDTEITNDDPTKDPTFLNNKQQGLDNSFPYKKYTWDVSGSGANFDGPGLFYENYNSSGYTGYSKVLENDNFTTWVMYQPPGGVWVPLQSYDWNWSFTSLWSNSQNQWNLWRASPASVTEDPGYKGADAPTPPQWSLVQNNS